MFWLGSPSFARSTTCFLVMLMQHCVFHVIEPPKNMAEASIGFVLSRVNELFALIHHNGNKKHTKLVFLLLKIDSR